MVHLIRFGTRFPDISGKSSPQFMLLSQGVLPVIILILQLYITLAQCVIQPHLFVIEVAELILLSLNNSCEPNPIDIFLLHKLITLLFPFYFKRAHLNPLLNKPSLQANDVNSNRPISVIYFISYLSNNDLTYLISKLGCVLIFSPRSGLA